eukprot:9153700-Alexandrium_andersonii.AAC.1
MCIRDSVVRELGGVIRHGWGQAKTPSGLTQDGDLRQRAYAALYQRGADSICLTEVSGHATATRIAEG